MLSVKLLKRRDYSDRTSDTETVVIGKFKPAVYCKWDIKHFFLLTINRSLIIARKFLCYFDKVILNLHNKI